jgi:glycosyltransferase involved in cell wall biosynthesis
MIAKTRARISVLGSRIPDSTFHIPHFTFVLLYSCSVDQQSNDSGPTPAQRADAQLRQLRETVQDLTAQVRDLEHQLVAVSVLRESPAGGDEGPSQADGPAQPAPAGTTALLKRTAKRAIRGTLGVARMVWGAADPAQRHVVAVRPTDEPAGGLPRLTVVVEADEIPEQLVRQTIEEFEVALWDRLEGTLAVLSLDGVEAGRSTARTRDELLALMSGDYVLWMPPGSFEIPATLLETLRWVAASESPLYIRLPVPGASSSDGRPARVMIAASREVWAPDTGVDLDRLADAAASRPLVGKTVGIGGDMDVAVPRLGSLGPGSHGVVCRTGRYDVWARNSAGPVEHLVRRLPQPQSRETPAESDRPAVMVIAAGSLTGGSDDLLAGAVAALIGHADPVVVTTSARSDLDLARTEQMERLDVPVYELGSTLDPSVWPSAVDVIAEGHRARAVVIVGTDRWSEAAAASLAERGVGVLRLPAENAPIPRGWPAAPRPSRVPADHRRVVRRELGVGEDLHLVMVAADFVPSSRLEDVASVAEELRGQRETVFMVVGEGPLAGHILDLVRYLDLDNVRVRRPQHDLCDLVAAADLVLDTAEGVATRPALVAAVVAGTPVVATPGAGARELLEMTGGRGIVMDSVGDPGAIADAIRRVRTSVGTPPDPAEVASTIDHWKRRGTEALRAAVLDLASPPAAE